ncbi:MAG TPA: HAMP domain-containing sensor histidine kinase [Ktedonobacterales bacterium]|nr:HAMP domain-containing sensor histidine kinase [Ktedonobacterales bacterium]
MGQITRGIMLNVRLARFFKSVRFHLTLWYLAVLAIILVAFGLTVYLSEQHALSVQFDDLLRARIQQVALTYDTTTQQLDISVPTSRKPAEASTISTATRGLNINEVGVLLSPQGQVLQVLGGLSPASATGIATLTLKASADTSRGYLVPLPGETLTLTTNGKPSDYGLISMAIFRQQQVVAYLTFGAPSNNAQQLSTLATTLLVAGAAVLLLAALGGFWLAGRAMRPIQAITATARQIGASDLSRRIALRRRDELGELAGTFDQMLDRLEKAFARQRQFTADASHELRTPLTIIELKVSRLLQQPDLPETEHAALITIQQERQHMTDLVDDLLFMARADTGHSTGPRELVFLDALILDSAERFEPMAQQRALRIEVGELPDLATYGDRLSLARMLGNLVENALKYSGSAGCRVQIALAPCERDGVHWARLTVSDDGPGIAARDLPHVFERFYRADAARTHSTGSDEASARAGSGLGLAIARWIAEAHGGAITLDSTIGKGTSVTITLPLASASTSPSA